MVGYLEAEFAALQRSKDATIRTLEPRVGALRRGGVCSPRCLAATAGNLAGDVLGSRGNEARLALQPSPSSRCLHLAPQVRNARFIGELCKFRIFPHGAAFSMVSGRPVLATGCWGVAASGIPSAVAAWATPALLPALCP